MVDGWNDEFDDELTACLLTQNTRKQLLKSLYICFSSFNLLLLPSHMFYWGHFLPSWLCTPIFICLFSSLLHHKGAVPTYGEFGRLTAVDVFLPNPSFSSRAATG